MDRVTLNATRLALGNTATARVFVDARSDGALRLSNESGAAHTLIAGNVQAGNASVTADLTVGGNLTVNGNLTYLDTQVQTTEQVTVTNAGTGPALAVRQNGTNDIATFRDDANVVVHIYDGGYTAIAPSSSTSLNASLTPPSGALLTVLGNVVATEEIRAPSFYGNLVGDFSGNVSGNLDCTNANFSGTLTVNGTTSKLNPGNYTYVTYSANTAAEVGTANADLSVSISATAGTVQAAQFVAMSDQRIKDSIAEVDPHALSDIISKIPVRTWKYKDVIAHGTRERLGFVAQDVETSGLEHAVRKTPGFIPDVYDKAVRDGDAYVLQNHGLSDDVLVRYADDSAPGFQEARVRVIDADRFALPSTADSVFVYGRQAEDILSLDFDSITAAAVGAIQDLQQRVARLERLVQ